MNLQQKRFKVIAETPFDKSPSLGTILTLEESGVSNWLTVRHNDFVYSEMMLKKYPHLFRDLQWWEHRELSEMNGYFIGKWRGDQYYIKVDKWEGGHPFFYYKLDGMEFSASYSKPITESEYNEYIKL